MSQINITLNGKITPTNSTSLQELISEFKIQSQYLAVAVNNCVIPSAEYASTAINDQDHVEIIQPVSGG